MLWMPQMTFSSIFLGYRQEHVLIKFGGGWVAHHFLYPLPPPHGQQELHQDQLTPLLKKKYLINFVVKYM